MKVPWRLIDFWVRRERVSRIRKERQDARAREKERRAAFVRQIKAKRRFIANERGF